MTDNMNSILIKPIGCLSLDELNSIIDYITYYHDDGNINSFKKVVIRAIKESSNNYDIYVKYKDTLICAIDRLYPNLFALKSDILKRGCVLCLKNNLKIEARKNMEAYIFNALEQLKYNACNIVMPYYSFRAFSDYALQDIKEETVSFAHPREFNDPLDTILLYWLDNTINISADDLQYKLLMKKVVEHIKIRCFIAGQSNSGNDIPVEELNALMWAHYADGHKGFCVKYEFDSKMFEADVSTKKTRLLLIDAVKYSKSISLKRDPSISTALLRKSDFWKYEKEMRMISFDCSGNDVDYPKVECTGAVKAIYLGVKCSEENRKKMEKILSDKDIPLFQMSVDENNLTRFKKQLIG